MSDKSTEMTILEIVRLLNTGLLLWDSVGALIQHALEAGQDTVTMDQVETAASQAGHDLDDLRAAIAASRAGA